MSVLQAIPHATQRVEPWANGAGSTMMVLREPDCAEWHVRVSVAMVDREGPFSELPATRRTLVPLDAPMTLRFPDGHESRALRFGTLQFDGAPAPTGLLPEGPTRDFNLMLRARARGEVLARTLVGAMVVPPVPDVRWLMYLHSGSAVLHADTQADLALNPLDAVLVIPGGGSPRVQVDGAGEIVFVKLYA